MFAKLTTSEKGPQIMAFFRFTLPTTQGKLHAEIKGPKILTNINLHF
jgi:hypothetical protein